MYDENGRERDVYDKILADIDALSQRCETLIVVTNEVGGGAERFDDSATRRYIETLGRLNRALAASSDFAAELVCGIPLVLKGKRPI
ncbi:hypothetical protein SDC9_143502 [bioreactor metagenome]|uniref:Adenosylcobinamide kinase n=1 Tax=bioreactor metagenome TaxID=1076179 RepID=A0A645E6Z6_9ZZZZ